MTGRMLLWLWLAAVPVRAQVAVSANDATEVMVDGVHVMVPNAPPDTVTITRAEYDSAIARAFMIITNVVVTRHVHLLSGYVGIHY